MTQRFVSKFSSHLLVGCIALGIFAQPAFAQGGATPQGKFLDAVRKGNGTDAGRLLNEGSSTLINTQDDSTGDTALHIAVDKADLQWVRYLLQNDANPNVANKKKMTPLMVAAQNGFSDGVDALLKRDARIDVQNSFGETALILAVQKYDGAMVKQLLKAGANPDKADYSGQSARSLAERDPRARSIAEIFKNGAGAEPEKPKTGKLDFSVFANDGEAGEESTDKPKP